MNPGQIIDEIWKLPWYQVAQVAFNDDFIFMCKIWPLFAFIAVTVIIILSTMTVSKRRSIQKKIEQCFTCHQLFSDPDTFLDEPDTQDIIVITSRINEEFVVSVHRSCAIDWIHTFGGVSKDLLNVESSDGLGKILTRHLKDKYKDVKGPLQIKVVKRGK